MGSNPPNTSPSDRAQASDKTRVVRDMIPVIDCHDPVAALILSMLCGVANGIPRKGQRPDAPQEGACSNLASSITDQNMDQNMDSKPGESGSGQDFPKDAETGTGQQPTGPTGPTGPSARASRFGGCRRQIDFDHVSQCESSKN